MAVKDLFKKKEKEILDYNFSSPDMQHLIAFKPAEKYIFRSDYFEIDSKVATIMTFVHKAGAKDGFGHFWGISLIPDGLPTDISICLLSQFERYSEGWLQKHQSKAEIVAGINSTESAKGGDMTSQVKGQKTMADLQEIAIELANGSTYINAHFRLMVKAPNIDALDNAMTIISRFYSDKFGTLDCAPYNGLQRKELSTLFSSNDAKPGKGFDFTSVELAGSYNLVTHGLEDPEGEYIGQMVGDVNRSAVLFDIDKYKHHIVIANGKFDETHKFRGRRINLSALWASKVSQAALLRGHRVAHLILDNTNLNDVGPEFNGITSRLDLNQGEVNMFEIFGKVEDELALFASNIQKIELMAEQAYTTNDNDRAILRNSLEKVLTQFYIDKKLWVANAPVNRDKVKVVGLPHEVVPTLKDFALNVTDAYTASTKKSDQETIHAMNVLKAVFENLLNTNGDLFNKKTSSKVDDIPKSQRMVYDFSKLSERGKGVAMAQLVNVISFVVGNLGVNDVLIIHGADEIDAGVKDFLENQITRLHKNGGRVVFVYNGIKSMLRDKDFSDWGSADYTITGMFSDTEVQEYQTLLGRHLPEIMVNNLQIDDSSLDFIHRGIDNVMVRRDLRLGI